MWPVHLCPGQSSLQGGELAGDLGWLDKDKGGTACHVPKNFSTPTSCPSMPFECWKILCFFLSAVRH